jgi:hypothetical protein
MKSRSPATREAAEMLAIQAFGFMAEEPERLGAFLSATGIAAEDIRAAAGDPAFLIGVLDHMLGNEQLLIGFADFAAIGPGDIAKARRALGGNWERDVP